MSDRHGWAHIRAYCICGGKLDVRSDPPRAAEYVHGVWRGIHSGPGHKPCDAATARRARARALKSTTEAA